MTIIFALNKQDITFYLVTYKGVFHSSSAALHYQSLTVTYIASRYESRNDLPR